VIEMAFKTVKDIPDEELFASGHRCCAGCPESMLARYIFKALGKNTIVISATSCLEIVSTPYPQTAWRVPWMHVAFENAGASASGVEAALKALMRKGKVAQRDINVIAIGGDGGTADIGLQSLSGALERGHDFMYICYDNEAYMNTGIQRSGATPFGASTTTTPAGRVSIGNETWKKDMPAIAAAHHIPYVATGCTSFPIDLMNKIKKGADVKGPAYLHGLAPCPTGWRFDSALTVEMGRLAVRTGLWSLYEMENERFRLTYQVKERLPVREYIRAQGRFRHLADKEIAFIQQKVDEIADKLGLGPLKA